jgi:hypothetical protein
MHIGQAIRKKYQSIKAAITIINIEVTVIDTSK